jgi:ketosteroid isomerase-like protein
MNRPEQQLVNTFLHAMMSRDADTLARVVAEDVVWHVPPSAMPQFRGPHRGPAGVVALVTGAGGTLFVEGTQRIEPVSTVVDGDQVAALFRMTARTLSGLDYDNLYAFFFRCSGGQIVEIRELVDTGYLYGLLGIEPTWIRSALTRGRQV